MDTQFYESLQNRGLLICHDSEGKSIIQRLNSLIQGDKWKQRFAICILDAILKKCDQDVLEENATSWMRFLLQTINTIPSENLLSLCFICLTQLLESASCIDKLSRDIATKGMDPLLALLVGSSLPQSPEKIKMIKCCVTNYPGPCGQYRSDILKMLICAIESDDHHLFSAACRMFTLLTICGISGEKKNRFVDNWANQFNQIISSTHYYITKFNNKINDIIDDTSNGMEENSKFIPFSDITEKLEIHPSNLSLRIERLLLMLQNFVSTAMPFEISFPVMKLVHLLCEVSNLLDIEVNKLSRLAIGASLLKITQALLKCITASVCQFASLLLPFCEQICKILSSSFAWSYLKNRTDAYQCMISVIDHWKVLPQNLKCLDIILFFIFNDMKICDKVEDNLLERNLSNRNNKNDTFAQDIDEKSKKKINHFCYISCQNAFAGLKLLERIIMINGPVMSIANINSVITNILNVFVKLYGKEGFLSPYNCEDNRLMAFKVASSLLMLHHGSVQIPTSIILSYFNYGTADLKYIIRSYCCDVLLQYDCIVHPLNPGFYENSLFISDDIEANESCNNDINPVETSNHSEASLSSGNSIDIKPKSEINSHNSTDGETFEAIVPPLSNNLTLNGNTHAFTRLCSSVDQISNEVQSSTLLTRPSSEPMANCHNNLSALMFNRNDNTSTPTIDHCSDLLNPAVNNCKDLYMENAVIEYSKVEDVDEDETVVISDSSEEENTPHIVERKRYQPAPRNGSVSLDTSSNQLESIYTPRSKKTKMNSGENVGNQEADTEFIAIMDTFCELDADD